MTAAHSPVTRTMQQFVWLHPEWWIMGLCGFAWTAMVAHSWKHFGHIHHWMTFPEEFLHWMLMVVAMMLPLVLDPVRTTAFGSLWVRRHRAMAGFLAGYLTPWLCLGIVAAGFRSFEWTHTYAAAALAFVIAALWQMTLLRARAMIACHRTLPLAPNGWRADCDCLRFGGTIGWACAATCWPLMVACMFTGHGLVAIAGGMALGLAERRSFRPRTWAVMAGTLALAGYYGVLAWKN